VEEIPEQSKKLAGRQCPEKNVRSKNEVMRRRKEAGTELYLAKGDWWETVKKESPQRWA